MTSRDQSIANLAQVFIKASGEINTYFSTAFAVYLSTIAHEHLRPLQPFQEYIEARLNPMIKDHAKAMTHTETFEIPLDVLDDVSQALNLALKLADEHNPSSRPQIFNAIDRLFAVVNLSEEA